MSPDIKTHQPYKIIFFVIEKHIENVREDEKHVPDLLEAILRPKLFVKEELRQKLFKMIQFGPEITKIQPKSLKSGFDPKVKSSKMGLSISPLANFCNGQPFFAIFGPARGHIYGKNAKKIGFERVRRLLP